MSNTVVFASEIVCAYIANNSVPAAELPALIQSVHGALDTILHGVKAPESAARPAPAVAIKKSIHYDYLISLENGKRYRTLKPHLYTPDLTPDEYRAKWGLAHDYPMTCKA